MSDPSVPANDITEDALLGGAVRLRQPKRGFRAAIDTVLLAAAVPARPGERVFEPGAGCAAAALCLARRAGCSVVGIELQEALLPLAAANARLNGMEDLVRVYRGAVGGSMPPEAAGPFDHAMANPPYGRAGEGTAPPDGARAAAHVEGEASLDGWIEAMVAALKPKGTLTLIHRADRLDAILAALRGRAGGAIVFPLWPRDGEAARRVIVQARKGVRAPLVVAAGLVLHLAGNRYSTAADAVLRGAPLELDRGSAGR